MPIHVTLTLAQGSGGLLEGSNMAVALRAGRGHISQAFPTGLGLQLRLGLRFLGAILALTLTSTLTLTVIQTDP